MTYKLPAVDSDIKARILNGITLDESSGCWLYEIPNPDAYPYISWGGESMMVRRLAYVEWKGEIFGYLKSICGHKHCVNPDHCYDTGHNTDSAQHNRAERLKEKRTNEVIAMLFQWKGGIAPQESNAMKYLLESLHAEGLIDATEVPPELRPKEIYL